jgi:hypothetical protein
VAWIVEKSACRFSRIVTFYVVVPGPRIGTAAPVIGICNMPERATDSQTMHREVTLAQNSFGMFNVRGYRIC